MPRLPHTSKQAIVLLWAMLQSPDDWQHGYALLQATGLKSGTLYPLLIRLADDGFLESHWAIEEGNAKPRRLYRLTASGRALANERLARLAQTDQATPKGTPA